MQPLGRAGTHGWAPHLGLEAFPTLLESYKKTKLDDWNTEKQKINPKASGGPRVNWNF